MMKSRNPGMLWFFLAALVGLSLQACTNVDLEKPFTPIETQEVKISVMGTYCVSDPESLVFPVKILFVIDDSGSMADHDPSLRRAAAARDLVNTLLDKNPENLFFGVEHFYDSLPRVLTEPVFTNKRDVLMQVLDDAQHAPLGGTPYRDALKIARDAIEEDMRADPLMAGRTRYIVLYLSDGEPTIPSGEAPPYTEILNITQTIKDLENGMPSAGEITIHTAYVQLAGNGNANAEGLLSEMARIGDGTFVSFPNGDAIDFKEFDVSAIARDYHQFFSIFVSNLSSRLDRRGLLADSDADGIADIDEAGFGADPGMRDTDGDGCGDKMEVHYQGWDPAVHGDMSAPRHCKCPDEERQLDSDGDGLTDCEEGLLYLQKLMADSDMDAAGNTQPDSMLDPLEIYWELGRTKYDAEGDEDADGFTNLTELKTHTDPMQAFDVKLRDDFAYNYNVGKSQSGGVGCYDFEVSNVHLVKTIAAEDREEGDNLFMLYFIEAPQDNPFAERIVKVAYKTVKFDGFTADPEVLYITPDMFAPMKGPDPIP